MESLKSRLSFCVILVFCLEFATSKVHQVHLAYGGTSCSRSLQSEYLHISAKLQSWFIGSCVPQCRDAIGCGDLVGDGHAGDAARRVGSEGSSDSDVHARARPVAPLHGPRHEPPAAVVSRGEALQPRLVYHLQCALLFTHCIAMLSPLALPIDRRTPNYILYIFYTYEYTYPQSSSTHITRPRSLQVRLGRRMECALLVPHAGAVRKLGAASGARGRPRRTRRREVYCECAAGRARLVRRALPPRRHRLRFALGVRAPFENGALGSCVTWHVVLFLQSTRTSTTILMLLLQYSFATFVWFNRHSVSCFTAGRGPQRGQLHGHDPAYRSHQTLHGDCRQPRKCLVRLHF